MIKKWIASFALILALLFTGKSEAVLIDVSFTLDASGSVEFEGWAQETSFVVDLITQFKALETADLSFRFAALSFASGVNVLHSFSDLQDPIDDIINAVQTAPYTRGATWTRSAVQAIMAQHGSVTEAADLQLAYLITDGNPSPTRTQTPCAEKVNLDASGIELTIIGVGAGLNFNTIECLVDSDNQLIEISDFSGLGDNNLQERLLSMADQNATAVNAPSTMVLFALGLAAFARRRG